MLGHILGISFGISNYFSELLPISFLHPLQFTTFLAVIYALFNFKSVFKISHKESLILFFLASVGLLIAVTRFFIFYHNDHLFSPIVRQCGSFILGWVSYLAFKDYFKKHNTSHVLTLICISSIFFTLIGLYQRWNKLIVGEFPRIVSLFSEPSYFGDYLVLIVAPCFIVCFENFKDFKKSMRLLVIATFSLWGLNIFFVQSGTAILKLVILLGCYTIFYPSPKKVKLSIIGIISTFILISIFVFKGYVHAIIVYAMEVYDEPKNFFVYHTFYDRFYSLYAAITKLFSLDGFFGLGFGGDYYEFKNLYPEEVHRTMISDKPSLSFFNSFISKIILYFGVFGVVWIFYLFTQAFKTTHPLIKISFLTILITSFFGIPNFSLPYFWFWLALTELDLTNSLKLSENPAEKT